MIKTTFKKTTEMIVDEKTTLFGYQNRNGGTTYVPKQNAVRGHRLSPELYERYEKLIQQGLTHEQAIEKLSQSPKSG